MLSLHRTHGRWCREGRKSARTAKDPRRRAGEQSGVAARYDLLLAGGTVLDPAQGLRMAADVAFAGGNVAAVQAGLNRGDAAETVYCSGLLVAPGMIDLHVHVFYGVSHYGIAPD